jgi:ABC-type transport system substrate-binding protein
VIALAVLVAGCGDAAPTDTAETGSPDGSGDGEDVAAGDVAEEFVISRGQRHDGWVPDEATTAASIHTVQTVLEPLLRYNPDGETIDPGLAASWEFDPEAPSYTFVLDDRATFSDGTPVTSADVAFSVQQWLEGPNYGELYAAIEEVVQVDESTVVFELAWPDTGLPLVLTWNSAAIIPDEFGGRTAEEFYADPIGAGAYAVESWSPGSEVVLVRNEHYYREGFPIMDRIRIVETDDVNQRVVAFQAGEVDVVERVPVDVLQQFSEEELNAAAPHWVMYAPLNTTRAPFDDVHARRAFAAAMNYDAVLDLWQGYGGEPQGALPVNVRNWVPSSEPWHTRDLDRAEALLADADLTGVGELEIIYDVSLGTDRLFANVIQESLAEIGLAAELRGYETASFTDALFNKDFDVAVFNVGAISPDVIDPVGYFMVTDYLFTGYDTSLLGEVFGAYTSTTDEDEQQDLIRRIQDDIYAELPLVPLATWQNV